MNHPLLFEYSVHTHRKRSNLESTDIFPMLRSNRLTLDYAKLRPFRRCILLGYVESLHADLLCLLGMLIGPNQFDMERHLHALDVQHYFRSTFHQATTNVPSSASQDGLLRLCKSTCARDHSYCWPGHILRGEEQIDTGWNRGWHSRRLHSHGTPVAKLLLAADIFLLLWDRRHQGTWLVTTAFEHALPRNKQLLTTFQIGHEAKAHLTSSATGGTGGEGARSYVQVFANSGFACILIGLHAYLLSSSPFISSHVAIFAGPYFPTLTRLLPIGIVAQYAAVAADTFSSELGILSKGYVTETFQA